MRLKSSVRQYCAFVLFLGFLIAARSLGWAQEPGLERGLREKIDQTAQQVLAASGIPSASIAVVKNGRIAYAQAYGEARLEPRVAAQPEMRYSIGSISKQFTATAILMLAEQGRLSLDDKVGKFIPSLTRANEVTIRQILSHTSGYQDYWPQDYVMPAMLRETTAEKILDGWARKPLDFEPGAQWQYSNTGYVIAGVIVEKASGMPLMQFLQKRIFSPLGMTSVADINVGRLTESDPTGYLRYALGPLRVAPKEGKGWLFAAGELAMTASDLAKWDISLMNQSLLKPASYKAMETEVLLNDGLATHYGLGVSISQGGGHRTIGHGGEVSGFTANNVVFPDDKVAIAVLTNQDAVEAASQITRRIAMLLLASDSSGRAEGEEQARKIFLGLQNGEIDRMLFTENANAYFSAMALHDFATSLAPLGSPESFTEVARQERGGMTFRGYRVRFPKKTLSVTVRAMPDGKIEQYQVAASD